MKPSRSQESITMPSPGFFKTAPIERQTTDTHSILRQPDPQGKLRSFAQGLAPPVSVTLKLKSGSQLPVSHFCAESEGFEPPDPLRSTVFKTAAFDHSANSPIYFPFVRDCKGTNIFVTCKLFYSFCFIFSSSLAKYLYWKIRR